MDDVDPALGFAMMRVKQSTHSIRELPLSAHTTIGELDVKIRWTRCLSRNAHSPASQLFTSPSRSSPPRLLYTVYVTCITEGPVRTGDHWNGKRVVDSISSMLLSTVDNITVMNFSTWMFRCSDYMYLIQDHKSKHVQ